MEDWHNFSADYDKTLMAWYRNLTNNWDKIKANYNERFIECGIIICFHAPVHFGPEEFNYGKLCLRNMALSEAINPYVNIKMLKYYRSMTYKL